MAAKISLKPPKPWKVNVLGRMNKSHLVSCWDVHDHVSSTASAASVAYAAAVWEAL